MAMAESPCLRRSFSNPSEITHDFHQQEDPLRALGESISFGRYMSESLAWERWSTFSHNRYLEEAEKSSKPGSVAKMKAYFEAHYSKAGAKKRALLEEANIESSDVEPEVQNTIENPVSLITENTLANDYATICEIPREEIPDVELQSSVIVSSGASFTPINELQEKEIHVMDSRENNDTTYVSPEVEVHECKDIEVYASAYKSSDDNKASQCADVQESDIMSTTPEKKLPIKEMEKGNSKSKRKSANSSVKQSVKSNVCKLSSSLARLSTPVRPKMECIDTPNKRKSAKESLDKKKSISRLINVSTNCDVKKASPMSRKTAIGKVFTPLGKIIRDRFTPSPAPIKEPRSTVARHPCVTPKSEIKRSKVALEKSFTGSKILDQKLKSPSFGNMNASLRSPTIFHSFSFRTEERAAKRREFFQKRLEKEAENMQLLEKAKVKPNTDSRKSSLNVNLKANDSMDRTEVLSDKTKKIASTRTQLPKCGPKPASDSARVSCPRPPQKTISSKLGTEKSKPVSTQSSTLPTKKKRHENTSPNIL